MSEISDFLKVGDLRKLSGKFGRQKSRFCKKFETAGSFQVSVRIKNHEFLKSSRPEEAFEVYLSKKYRFS